MQIYAKICYYRHILAVKFIKSLSKNLLPIKARGFLSFFSYLMEKYHNTL